MVQRLLAAPSESESRWALFGSWVVIAMQFTLFLVIGAILFVYYLETGGTAPQPAERVYPQFIWDNLPPGVAGLVIAAILAAAMSNLSAALNSLSSTTIMDFYRPMTTRLTGIPRPEEHYLKLARWATIAWGVVLVFCRLGGTELGVGSKCRPVDCIDPLRRSARCISARDSYPAYVGERRYRGHGGQFRDDVLREELH